MTAAPPKLFDRDVQRQRLLRAAPGFARHDALHVRATEDLAERLSLIERRFATAVVLGRCGTDGHAALLATGKIGRLLQVVPSAKFAGSADCLVADDEALPFAPASVDLFVSMLTLHTGNDLPGALIQMRRALKPDGLMLAALFGGRTLQELRASFATAESELEGGISPRVAPFADVRDLGGLLQRAGFALPVADSDVVTLTYSEPLGLLRDLRGAGCASALTERSRRPLRRATLARMLELYRGAFPAPDGGKIAATFEIVTLTGWAPDSSQQQPLQPGTAKTRLADALGVHETTVNDGARDKC